MPPDIQKIEEQMVIEDYIRNLPDEKYQALLKLQKDMDQAEAQGKPIPEELVYNEVQRILCDPSE